MRKKDAERAADQSDPPNAQEVFNRELEADREHQQDDADLGEQLHGVDVRNTRTGREWADEHARQHVTEDDRLAKLPCQHPPANRGEKNVSEVPEKQRVGFQPLSPVAAGARLCY